MWSVWISLVLCYVSVLARPAEDAAEDEPHKGPIVYRMHIDSNIKYRYAQTLISSKVVNPSSKAQEYLFHVVLPEAAFITGFVMTINDKDYRAYVKEKEEAKQVYDQAVQQGLSAAHVAYNPRDSNDFQVSINIEPQNKVLFNLTYDDFLSRQLGSYEHKININPGQIVEDLKVTVNIEDVSPIINLKVPELKMTNEILSDDSPNSLAKIESSEPEKVKISWTMTPEEQRALKAEGISGQFIVKYDVDRAKNPHQILVNDGYFVHFFSNDNLPSLNKYVVFVLDLSGSMAGRKMEQLKSAMIKILNDLKETDFFSIVLFSNDADVWAPNKNMSLHNFFSYHSSPVIPEPSAENIIAATKENVKTATEYVDTLTDLGGTNIIAGLRLGIKLTKMGKIIFDATQSKESKPQPIVVFLTDGEPNVEEANPKIITEKTTQLNSQKNPIFSLGFGTGADINFLRNLSLANNGFARSIYEASDAALQLEEFFKTISSPLLSNVKFEYLPGQISNDSTKSSFYNLFSGGELVVAGKLSEEKEVLDGKLVANGLSGVQEFILPEIIIIDCIPIPPVVAKNKSYGPLEKMWAYKSIKQLIDDSDLTQNKESKQKALELALKYSFVTPLTSLVVVKPNESLSLDVEKKKDTLPMFMMGAPVQQLYSYSAAGAPGAAGGAASFSTSMNIASGFGMARPALPMAFPGQMPPAYPSTPMVFSKGPLAPPSLTIQDALPDSSFGTQDYSVNPTTVAVPQPALSPGLVKVDLSDVSWLGNETIELNGETFIKPPSELSDTHLIALNKTMDEHQSCTTDHSGEGHCVHFIYCPLLIFSDTMQLYNDDFKCYIGTEYLGVCCPDKTLHPDGKIP